MLRTCGWWFIEMHFVYVIDNPILYRYFNRSITLFYRRAIIFIGNELLIPSIMQPARWCLKYCLERALTLCFLLIQYFKLIYPPRILKMTSESCIITFSRLSIFRHEGAVDRLSNRYLQHSRLMHFFWIATAIM